MPTMLVQPQDGCITVILQSVRSSSLPSQSALQRMGGGMGTEELQNNIDTHGYYTTSNSSYTKNVQGLMHHMTSHDIIGSLI